MKWTDAVCIGNAIIGAVFIFVFVLLVAGQADPMYSFPVLAVGWWGIINMRALLETEKRRG